MAVHDLEVVVAGGHIAIQVLRVRQAAPYQLQLPPQLRHKRSKLNVKREKRKLRAPQAAPCQLQLLPQLHCGAAGQSCRDKAASWFLKVGSGALRRALRRQTSVFCQPGNLRQVQGRLAPAMPTTALAPRIASFFLGVTYHLPSVSSPHLLQVQGGGGGGDVQRRLEALKCIDITVSSKTPRRMSRVTAPVAGGDGGAAWAPSASSSSEVRFLPCYNQGILECLL